MYTRNEEQNRSCSTVFYCFSNQGISSSINFNSSSVISRIYFFLSATIDQAPKKVRFMFILANGLVFGFEALGRKRRANISLKPAKYLRRYSRCKHCIEKYLCLIYRFNAEFMNHSIRVVHSPRFMYFELLFIPSGGSRPSATVDTSLLFISLLFAMAVVIHTKSNVLS